MTGVGGSEGGIHHKCIVEYKSGNLEIKTEWWKERRTKERQKWNEKENRWGKLKKKWIKSNVLSLLQSIPLPILKRKRIKIKLLEICSLLAFEYKKIHVNVEDKWSVLVRRNGDIQTTRLLPSSYFFLFCLFGSTLEIFLCSDFELFFTIGKKELRGRRK